MNSKYQRRIVNGENIWVRNCPKCSSEIFYSTSGNTSRAEKNKSVCGKCGSKKLKRDWYKNHSLKIVTENDLIRFCPECQCRLVYKSRRTKNRAARIHRLCRTCSGKKRIYGPMSKDHKRKISKSHIKRMLSFGIKIQPSYNPDACRFFNNLNDTYGWNLKHAMNGGEKRVFRYFLDAFDEKKNIVVEYDESHHYTSCGELKEADVVRMKNVIKKTGCSFYRYNEKTNLLTKFNRNGKYEAQYEIVSS